MKEYEVLLEIVSRLEEIQQDLFCSGLQSVPEYVFCGLSELKEEAGRYGMVYFEQNISCLLERLERDRHSMQKNETEVMEAYVVLYQFNRQLKQRLQRDKIKDGMFWSE